MKTAAKKMMTVDEFLRWGETQERGRYELHDGEVVVMAPERAAHWDAKLATVIALREAIARAGLHCHAVPDGATVRISDRTAFEPDALVYCGERVKADALEVPNPLIVAEVLSPSSAAMDMRDKLKGYFSLASLHHYLIVDPEKRLVIHHTREHGDILQTRILTEGGLRLDPPGLDLPVPALFS